MEAIILAGGLGTRLRSVVSDVPKCMAPVAGRPFLFYILNYLEKYNFNHVILSLGFRHEIVEEWIINKQWSFKISFSVEGEPLGTGGAIKQALKHAQENQVFVMNGDTFFDVNLDDFYHFHVDKNAQISIALKPLEYFERYGNVLTDINDKITAFKEKEPCKIGQINGGIYIVNKESGLMKIGKEKFSFETDVLQKMANKENIFAFVSSGYFIDIGIPEDYSRANIDFKDK